MNDNEYLTEEEIEQQIDSSEDIEDMIQEEVEEDNFDSELMNNARLRLEQGRLYEMLLKHDFFEGMDSDPRAVANVQREIKKFVKERLEILVGLRPDPKLVQPNTEYASPFNPLEIELLKKMLAKASQGATLVAETQPEPKAPAQKPKLNPIKLNPVQQPKKMVVKEAERAKPASQKAQPKAQPKPENKEPEALEKSPYKMSTKELMEESKKRNLKGKYWTAKSPDRIPPPDVTQATAFYGATQQNVMNAGVGKILNLMYGHGAVKPIEDVSNSFETSPDERI